MENMKKMFLKLISRVVLVIALIVSAEQSFGQEIPVFKWANGTQHRGCYAGYELIITASDAVGNAYVMSRFCNTFDADPGTGVFQLSADNSNYDDLFLIKFDINGNFVWAKTFGDAPYYNFADAIQIDALGNVFAATHYQRGYEDYRTNIFKFDIAGNPLWEKTIYTARGYGHSIVVDAAQNVLITGAFSGTIDADPGAGEHELISNGAEVDLFVVKLDNNGNFVWAKKTGGTGIERGASITTDISGNIIIGGYYSGTADFNSGGVANNFTSAGSIDVFILKLSPSGNFMWAKSMGGIQEDRLTSIAVNAAGNIFATGFFKGSGDFDPNAGTTMLTATQYSDIFLMRLNADGSFGWASGFGGADNDEGRAITTDAEGNLIFTGIFNGTVDFDPGVSVKNLVSIGQNSYQSTFLVKFNENQELIWAQEIGHPTNTAVAVKSNTISIDDTGEITIGGLFGGADLDFRTCSKSNAFGNGFIMKITTGLSPTITSFSPSSGAWGTQVVITGKGFSPIPSNNTVMFGTKYAVVTASTSTSITTTVPSNGITGKISVITNCITALSDALFGSLVGVEEDIHSKIKMYPNPVQNEFIIERNGKQSESSIIRIYTLTGLLVAQYSDVKTGLQRQAYDLSHLPSGIYFLNISDMSGFMKLIKE